MQYQRETLDRPTLLRLVNIKDAVVALSTVIDWHEIAILTDSDEIVWSEDRLERSRDWGDDDYGGHVLNVLRQMVERDAGNEYKVVQYALGKPELKSWKPELHDQMSGVADYLRGIPILGTEHISAFDHLTPYVDRVREGQVNDHEAAIGACKDLVEAALKTFLELPEEETKRYTMPQLIKLARKKLVDDFPERENDEDLLKMLSNLGQMVASIGSIRNKHGTGHGRGPAGAAQLPQPYVGLLANASISISTFLTQMLGLRTDKPDGNPSSDFIAQGEELPW